MELSLSDKLAFYTAQHIGLVLCALGVGLLALGYDKGLMHNTVLCLVSLGICLVGLFFHEFRPFNVSGNLNSFEVDAHIAHQTICSISSGHI